MNSITLSGHTLPLNNERLSESGNRVYDLPFGFESRYVFDLRLCVAADGWLQFDTPQDAPYFGVWVNPTRRLLLTYAEGDTSIVICATDAAYNAEVRAAITFHGTAPAFKSLDADGTLTHHYADPASYMASEPRAES